MATARPILFSAPMIRALLAGTKTQTRRVMKSQPYSNGFHFDGQDILCHNDYLPPSAMLMDVRSGNNSYTDSDVESRGFVGHCPHGQPGDLLWVRETWAKEETEEEIIDADTGPSGCYHTTYRWIHYRATPHKGYRVLPDRVPVTHLHESQPDSASTIKRWKPAIHMPRYASRLTLRLTAVRVERLQEISADDAFAEGIDSTLVTSSPWIGHCAPAEVHAYAALWESINGAGSWAANPWVWCLSFNVIKQNVDTVLKAAA